MTEIKTKPKTHRPNASRKPLTPEEAIRESVGIRWVAGTSIAGRPTLHDVFDYIVERGPAIDCNCERCADWKARFAAGAGAVAPSYAAQAIQQVADVVNGVRQELELAAAEGESAAAETARILRQALDALELVMREPVGDGIQVRQRIGAELAYGIGHTIRALHAQIALFADGELDVGGAEAAGGRDVDDVIDSLPQQRRDKIEARAAEIASPAPVRDIQLPDGSVRHNVGSDNLSDEDREAMALTDEQVAALNEDERRNGPYGGAPASPTGGLHPSHTTRISMDASSYDEICTKCGATDIAGGGWGRLAQPCTAGAPAEPEPQPEATYGGVPFSELSAFDKEKVNQGYLDADPVHDAGADDASSLEAPVPSTDVPLEPGDSESAASQSGVMAALLDNVRNSGHKWVFGSPVVKDSKSK